VTEVVSSCGIEGEIEYRINLIFYNEGDFEAGVPSPLAIHALSVPDFQDQYRDLFVLDVAD
jgi:hypothetical protein